MAVFTPATARHRVAPDQPEAKPEPEEPRFVPQAQCAQDSSSASSFLPPTNVVSVVGACFRARTWARAEQALVVAKPESAEPIAAIRV
jgi:hypothetical protein